MKDLKILIYEDMPSDVALAKIYLRPLEYNLKFQETDNESDFVSILDTFAPDIILSDYNLPKFNGMQALKIAREKMPHTPFVFVTGSLGEEKAVEAIKAGASDFILKGRAKNLPFVVLKALREAKEIKARVEANQKSMLMEQRFKALIENSTEGLTIFDDLGVISYTSPAITRIMGYLPEEVIGQNSVEFFIHSDDLNAVRDVYRKLLRGHSDLEILICRSRRKDGEYVWLETVIADQRNVAGVNAFVANYRNVTEKINAQQKLQHTLLHLEDMVDQRTVDLKIAHKKVEDAHADIKHSINYAKKIQDAILPSEEELKKIFTDFFIIYKPKDIVSGDFYWAYKNDSISLVSLVDCTGHGVPGALMSMIGNEILDHIVKDKQITRPDVILEEMDKSVNKLLRRKSSQIKVNDGMDMSICCLNYETSTLYFSGAQHSGILVSNGKFMLLKGTKHSIGGLNTGVKDFERTSVSFQSGDRLYLFSDGFHDQFGGAENKKFMKKNFYNLLEHSNDIVFNKQKKNLTKIFKEWKGNHEQVDDVTVLGIIL